MITQKIPFCNNKLLSSHWRFLDVFIGFVLQAQYMAKQNAGRIQIGLFATGIKNFAARNRILLTKNLQERQFRRSCTICIY